MTDLPVSPAPTPISSFPNKEVGVPSLVPEMPAVPVHEVDRLPKEVASAGVSVRPTTIPIPKPIANIGVTPGPANIPMPSATVALPISDDEIAVGLGKSVVESWRWLAEWCLRRLKQVHIGLMSVHGKLTRVQMRT